MCCHSCCVASVIDIPAGDDELGHVSAAWLTPVLVPRSDVSCERTFGVRHCCFCFDRAGELLKAGEEGGLDESSGDQELSEAEGVLAGLRASPVVYPQEEVSNTT